MAKNYMPEVAKMLGVAIGEEFDVLNENDEKVAYNPYKVTDNGIEDCEGDVANNSLIGLLIGEYTLQKRPWKPKDREGCWRIFVGNIIDHTIFEKDNIYDLAMVAMGNCFPTKEAAEAGKEEILAKFEEIRKEVRE